MKLKEQDIQVWMDKGELEPGEEWRNAIDKGISSSAVLLVILTPSSCASPYVTYEWAYAIGHGRAVIPLLRQDANIHPRLDVYQYIDFRDSKLYPWQDLVLRIQDYFDAAKDEMVPKSVGQLSVEQLQDMIHSTVSLATAQRKTDSKVSSEQHITSATQSVIDAIGSPTRSIRGTKKPNILWVDDRPDNNIHERAALESMGYGFELARSTQEAMEALNGANFSAIISDMGRLEGPNEGYMLLDQVRGSRNNIPFFIYAGSNAKKHKEAAIERGAQGSTNKPRELFDFITSTV